MLRKHRGFIVFITVAGVGARLIWDAATNRQDPPLWVTLLVAALIVTVAMRVEAWVDRRNQAPTS
ncbi:hypothetical protein AB0L71_28320 [Streptomyces sp. NPDC052052]|uniref:hypothetical protein n=1 Tax=Streptomyces sp. NPDC052052 TaxID=3154756 RepID=UPI0034477944